MLNIKSQNIRLKNKNVPEKPGIYVFYNKKTPIYIGKAINLKLRLNSYFAKSAYGKSKEIANSSDRLGFVVVTSDFEALLLESNLIKQYKPRFNVSLKDDKSPIYIRITGDIYPLVLTARKGELKESDIYFGPFPSSQKVYEILKIVRRIYPYSSHQPQKTSCLYSQLGLCQPCPSLIEITQNPKLQKRLKKEYLSNIDNIIRFLKGDIKPLIKDLEQRIKYYSLIEDYENARIIKKKIDVINYITEPHFDVTEFLKNPEFITDIRNNEKEELEDLLLPYFGKLNIKRIECFDVAHIQGALTTASMITFIDGDPEKSLYRRFKIRQIKGGDDISSMQEVISRRIKHFPDWGKPDLILVDGGKGQVAVFFNKLKDFIPVVGIAKRYETLVIPQEANGKITYTSIILKKGNIKNLLQRLRNEAHRFARKYHHLLLTKELLKKD